MFDMNVPPNIDIYSYNPIMQNELHTFLHNHMDPHPLNQESTFF